MEENNLRRTADLIFIKKFVIIYIENNKDAYK